MMTALDEAWNELHARDNALEVYRRYLANDIPSRSTFANCLDAKVRENIYVP
jgi:hypothetical protein